MNDYFGTVLNIVMLLFPFAPPNSLNVKFNPRSKGITIYSNQPNEANSLRVKNHGWSTFLLCVFFGYGFVTPNTQCHHKSKSKYSSNLSHKQ